jgi:nitroreductase
METTQAIQGWRSIRKFKSDPVPEDKLRAVLEAARRAPSWENIQPWRFIVVEDQLTKDMLTSLAKGQKFVGKAPVVICVAGDLSAWDKPKNKAALMQLVEAGVMKVNEQIIDTVLLNDPAFCVAENGPATILARTFEQLGIAYGFMCAEIINQGLGACIVGALSNEVTGAKRELYQSVKQELGLDDSMYLLAMLPVGFPDQDPPARPRKDFDAIVSRGRLGQKF